MRRTVLCLLAGSAFFGVQTVAHAQGFSLFPGSQKASGQSQVVQVQATDSGRIMQLEEQVRNLTGQVEDLSFQMLQMEEKIRKMQEDMEFRLQDLESGGAGGGSRDTGAADGGNSGSSDSAANITTPPPAASSSTSPSVDIAPDLPEAAESGGDDATFYQTAYDLVLSGDYPQAEQAFGEFVLSYPDSPLMPDASFWLGESMLAQQKYSDAAKTFLNAYKAYGNSDKAPEMLLKLGQSLAGMDNKDAACATFSEVPTRYPDAAQAVLSKASSEMTKLGC